MGRFQLVVKKKDTKRKMMIWNKKKREMKLELLKKKLGLKEITYFFSANVEDVRGEDDCESLN